MPVSAAAGTIVGSAYAQTSFHGDAVADVAALTAIVASNRFDRQERTVETPLNQYVFDEQSAAADNPPDILEPDDSPATGRWIRLVPGGGVPLAHAVSHSDGGSDEITVENLATSEVSTTKALMSDGAGGLVFGAPVAAAHAIGGAVHTADTLSNLNAKINDANLVDGASIVLTSGANPLTGSWNVGGFQLTGLTGLDPSGDGVDNLGTDANAWGTIRVRNIRADVGQNLSLRGSDGFARVVLTNTLAQTFGTWQHFGQQQIFSSLLAFDEKPIFIGSGSDTQLVYSPNPTQTNSGLLLGLQGAEGNYFLVTDKARVGLNRALPTFSTPTVVFEDGGVAAGKWGSIRHDGTNLIITTNAGAGDISVAARQIIGLTGLDPNGDGVDDLGTDANAWGTLRVRNVRPDPGQILTLSRDDGTSVLTIATNSDVAIAGMLIGDADGTRDLGQTTRRWRTFHSFSPFLRRLVEANTDVAASPNALSQNETYTLLTNEGTGAENHHDLPSAVAGLNFTFVVQDADGIQINAATGDTIRIGASVTATGGDIASATIGDIITLHCINTTEWIGLAADGANNWVLT